MARRILLDSGVLLLLFVGLHDRSRIARSKNTEKFTPEDFDTLVSILPSFDRIVTTPHILTEVSNLAGQMGEPARSELFEVMRNRIEVLDEVSIPAAAAAGHESFVRLGITDVGIATAMRGEDRCVVLTIDLDLWLLLRREGFEAENFNHVRMQGWHNDPSL